MANVSRLVRIPEYLDKLLVETRQPSRIVADLLEDYFNKRAVHDELSSNGYKLYAKEFVDLQNKAIEGNGLEQKEVNRVIAIKKILATKGYKTDELINKLAVG